MEQWRYSSTNTNTFANTNLFGVISEVTQYAETPDAGLARFLYEQLALGSHGNNKEDKSNHRPV
jgi:hypothetical protein